MKYNIRFYNIMKSVIYVHNKYKLHFLNYVWRFIAEKPKDNCDVEMIHYLYIKQVLWRQKLEIKVKAE